tara:strand:+ start:8921 stop:9547 length:627 start_codon:yes stop_codon:yes gene_type:complete
MVEIIRLLLKIKFIRFILKFGFFIASCTVFMVAKLLMDELDEIENWNKVPAKVVSSKIAKTQATEIYYIDLDYSYKLNGKLYTGGKHINKSADKSKVEQAISQYKEFTDIEVWIDPKDDANSEVVFKDDYGDKVFNSIKIFFCIALLFLTLSIILLFKGVLAWLFSLIGGILVFDLTKKVITKVKEEHNDKKAVNPRDGETIQRTRNI